MIERLDYLVIGGGIAGTTAADELRRLAPESIIGIVSEEDHPLYSRVLLPHYVKGKIPRERVFFKTWEWYAEKGIEVFRGRTAMRIAISEKEVTLDDGTVVGYGKLLVASGGRVRELPIPGADHAGVVRFRTIDDADRIVSALEMVSELPEDDRHACIVGGGFIGLEFPSIFRARGFRTSMLIRGPYYWSRTWDEVSGRILSSTLTEHGVELYNSEECDAVVGDNSLLRSIQTASGKEISARILGFGVGLLPNVECVRAAGVTCERGVLTNEFLETNAPDVYAAGDVAEFWNPLVGTRQLLGSWMNAQEQGRVAAANMAGDRKTFSLVSQYATTVFDLVVSFIGDVRMDSETVVVTRGDEHSRQYARFILRGGRMVGATLCNRVAERGPIAKLIAREMDLRDCLAALADPAVKLETLL